MSDALYPIFDGLMFDRLRTPQWNTLKQRAASGREVRVALMSYPLWSFRLQYSLLRWESAFQEFQQLVDFFNARMGSYDSFLFDDPNDNSVVGYQFGTGDGNTVGFQLTRTMYSSGFIEPVMNINGTPQILDNGANASNYSIDSYGYVTFNSAPTAGHNIAWTGSYYYRARFTDDQMEFNEFMYRLLEAKRVEFVASLGAKV